MIRLFLLLTIFITPILSQGEYFFPVPQINNPACSAYTDRETVPSDCIITPPLLTPEIQNSNPSGNRHRIYSVLWTAPYTAGRSRGLGSHGGVDIVSVRGTPVVAMATGTVIIATYKPGRGNLVVIQHKIDEQTIYSTYAHLERISVQPTQSVGGGTMVGTIGDTGLTTGPHLHFQLDRDLGQQVPYGFSLCPDAKGRGIFQIVNNGLCQDLVRTFTIDPVLFFADASIAKTTITIFGQEFQKFDDAYRFLVDRGETPETIGDQFVTKPTLDLPTTIQSNLLYTKDIDGLSYGKTYRIRSKLPIRPATLYGTNRPTQIQILPSKLGIYPITIVDDTDTVVYSQTVTVSRISTQSESTVTPTVRCAHADSIRQYCILGTGGRENYDLIIDTGIQGGIRSIHNADDRKRGRKSVHGTIRYNMRRGKKELSPKQTILILYHDTKILIQKKW